MPETTYTSYRRRNGTNGYHRNGTNGRTNGTHDQNRDRDWGDRSRYDWDRNRRYPSTQHYRYPTRYTPPYKWGHYKQRRYNHVYNPWAGYRAPRAWWYDWWDSWVAPWINPVVSWLWPNPILPAGQQYYQPPIIYP